MTLAPVRRPTCEARPAAWKASPITYTPPWKYAAQLGCGHGHVGGWRLRRGRLPEQPSLLAHVAVEREGVLAQGCVEILSLFAAHRVLPSAGVMPGTSRLR